MIKLNKHGGNMTLKEQREKTGLSQRMVAKALDVDTITVWNWEKNGHIPYVSDKIMWDEVMSNPEPYRLKRKNAKS